jgi:hypothetical protein
VIVLEVIDSPTVLEPDPLPVRMACGPPCNGNGGWWIFKDGMPDRWVSCDKCANSKDD